MKDGVVKVLILDLKNRFAPSNRTLLRISCDISVIYLRPAFHGIVTIIHNDRQYNWRFLERMISKILITKSFAHNMSILNLQEYYRSSRYLIVTSTNALWSPQMAIFEQDFSTWSKTRHQKITISVNSIDPQVPPRHLFWWWRLRDEGDNVCFWSLKKLVLNIFL